MTPQYQFIKVAAGESVDTGSLVCYMQPDLKAMVRELTFGPSGKAPHDFWKLVPVPPAADGGIKWVKEILSIIHENDREANRQDANKLTIAYNALNEIEKIAHKALESAPSDIPAGREESREAELKHLRMLEKSNLEIIATHEMEIKRLSRFLNIVKPEKCKDCCGSGKKDNGYMKTVQQYREWPCFECNGSGLTPAPVPDREAFIEKVAEFTHYAQKSGHEVARFMRIHFPETPAPVDSLVTFTEWQIQTALHRVLPNSIENKTQLISRACVELYNTSSTPAPVTRQMASDWADDYFNDQDKFQGPERKGAMAMFDYLQGKALTPADPGSQVEAVDFTEWWINEGWQIRKNGTFIQIGASGTPMLGRPDDRIKSVNELFTLYKQSL